MNKMFRERDPRPLGLVVVVWLVVAVATVLNINSIVGAFGQHYTAELSEAAGIKQGDPVMVSGLEVGRVSSVKLGGDGVLVEFTITNDDIRLGSQSTARVSVATVLGDKALVVESQGNGELADEATIPLERTQSPYDVSEALADLTTETGRIDVDRVVHALDQVSQTMEGSGPELRAAIDGVGRISTTIGARDESLRSLLAHADDFSAVLADRSADMTALVSDGNLLFAELLKRRQDIELLLGNVTAMAQQLSGLVDDNQESLKPRLAELNRVIALLRANKANIARSIEGLSVYATGLGEVVASGPFFTAILQNLLPGNLFPPVLGRADSVGGQ
jgi:phospholipid/cholesterol/gamma-HCH transport system substrate-binding protein